MRIAERNGCHFTIRRIGIDSGQHIHAKVHSAGFGFTGANKSVWFHRDRIDEFLRDLRKLDAARIGTAEIESMSPDECRLRIQNSDQLGHLNLDVLISRYRYTFGKADRIYCRTRIEIDPTEFPRIVAEFTAELVESPA
jgi:hypothetical protein